MIRQWRRISQFGADCLTDCEAGGRDGQTLQTTNAARVMPMSIHTHIGICQSVSCDS
jgi:hypothetical protein